MKFFAITVVPCKAIDFLLKFEENGKKEFIILIINSIFFMENMGKSTETGSNKTQSAIIAALVIGLLVGFFIGRSWGGQKEEVEKKASVENVENAVNVKDSISSEVKTKEDAKNEPVSSGSVTGEVTAADQSAGMSALVSKVTLSEAGWVVVREDSGEAMGNILGAHWLPAGTATNVSVELLRGTEAKKNYFVALYTDNGDKKFDKAIDLPIEINGKIVSSVFSAK